MNYWLDLKKQQAIDEEWKDKAMESRTFLAHSNWHGLELTMDKDWQPSAELKNCLDALEHLKAVNA